jgi:hypothetical protein
MFKTSFRTVSSMPYLRHRGGKGSVALTIRTQYVHRTLRLFSYSSDPGAAAHWSSCSERIAPRSVAHLCQISLAVACFAFFCNTYNYRYSSITVFSTLAVISISARATATALANYQASLSTINRLFTEPST